MHRVSGFLFTSVFAFLATGTGLWAQEPPSMPMQARNEDGANYRWLAKKVLASRLLDGMEDLSNWTFRGQGEMTLSDARTHQGAHSLQVRSVVPPPDPTPGARRPGQGHMSASRAFPGEDWSAFNRISVWIYPDIVGTRFISFAVTMHNDGKQKVPDRQNEGRDESVLLNNHAWNHVVWEIEPIARDKVTAIDLQYTEPKMLPDPEDSTVFYFDQLELERVVADPWDRSGGWVIPSSSPTPCGSSPTCCPGAGARLTGISPRTWPGTRSWRAGTRVSWTRSDGRSPRRSGWPTCGWTKPPRSRLASARSRPGAGPSGSRRPSLSGRSSVTPSRPRASRP